MFRTPTTRTIAAVAAFMLLTSSGSVFARAKEGHGRGKKEPHRAEIGPGGGISHPDLGGIRADRVTTKSSHFQDTKEFAFAVSSLFPSRNGEPPTVQVAFKRSGGSGPWSESVQNVVLGWLAPVETGSADPGTINPSGTGSIRNGKNFHETKPIVTLLPVVVTLVPPGSYQPPIDTVDAADSSRSASLGSGTFRATTPVFERPALRIPRLLDRASFSVTRDGENGLEAGSAVTFQF